MEKEHEIKTVVPALRFPEFREMEGWRHNIVNNLTSVITAPKKITSQEYLNTGYYPIIDQSQNYICGWTNDESAVITEASLSQPLIIFGDHTCILKKVTFPFAQGADGIKILKTKECINGFFLYQILLANPVTQEEYKRHYSILKEKTIYYPIINSGEQQKIADCLSSLDDLIEATNRKIEVLKEHKKGLMQRLFPKEGKNVPELRFPEFQETKGWAKKQIIDLGEVITGNTPSKKEGKYWNGDFAWITAQDFKGKYINDSILKLTRFGKNKARVIPQNSVLVTCIASIGLNAINKIECSTNQQINTICCNRKYHYEYVYYLITYNVKRLKQLAGQTAVPIITKKNFEEFEVYTVENYDEQQKIADCLSSLDELIEATSQKVEILKEHKKGLMQQLFPKI
ncbi:MAG TPA: restriction endonuclease subunit S [Candidatus Phocaeicola excrementigallinarum]|nr:restriction endonuclease subunit S [Candidatus Phocaeicola excrementigallinarum]